MQPRQNTALPPMLPHLLRNQKIHAGGLLCLTAMPPCALEKASHICRGVSSSPARGRRRPAQLEGSLLLRALAAARPTSRAATSCSGLQSTKPAQGQESSTARSAVETHDMQRPSAARPHMTPVTQRQSRAAATPPVCWQAECEGPLEQAGSCVALPELLHEHCGLEHQTRQASTQQHILNSMLLVHLRIA
jgi:hypothetical protein